MGSFLATIFAASVTTTPAESGEPETGFVADGSSSRPDGFVTKEAKELVGEQSDGALGQWTAGAFVDLAYLLNSNFPDNHIYRGTATTPRTGEFTLNLAAAYLSHDVSEDEPWGLELALQFGAGTDSLYAAEPIPGEESGRLAGAEVWKHVALANARGRIRKSNTELGAGLFASPIGIGGFWSRYNWNYSPSWESNAAPFFLMGARVEQELTSNLSAQAWVVNGWQTMADANAWPAYLLGLSWAKGLWNAAQFVYAGPEQDSHEWEHWRFHSDTQLTWNTAKLGIGAVWDYGQEQEVVAEDMTSPMGKLHRWTGGGLFFRARLYKDLHRQLELAVRPDAWYEEGNRIFGQTQWLTSGTVTLSATWYEHLLTRLEYRYDRSSAKQGFFYRGSATVDVPSEMSGQRLAQEQHTVFFNLVGYFDHRFGGSQ